MPECEVCKDLKVLAKGVPWGSGYATIYPLGTKIGNVIIPCPACATEEHKQQMAVRSQLEPIERTVLLADWKTPRIPDHPGWTAQRKVAKQRIGEALQRKSGLYTFWGDYGAGKSFALRIIVNEMRELYQAEGYYATFAGILDHLRSMWSRKQDTSNYWERLLTVPVLAVDEVTRFNEAKEWEQEKLFLLVDTRYRRALTHLTVFATNENPNRTLPPEEGIGYLFSRMREGKVVELRGDVRAALGGKR